MGICLTAPQHNDNVSEVAPRSDASPRSDAPSPSLLSRRVPSWMPKKDVKEGGIGRSQFILDRPGRIQDTYSMDKKKLGEGTYGSVCRSTHKSTKVVRAIKTIPKGKMRNVERFKKEIAIMKMMDHPNIIKLFETFEDHRNIYLAMELCTGGELFERIIQQGSFGEGDAATVMQQALRAVRYMHEHKIAHRDLKPENFLFQSEAPICDNVLKLIDFGLACNFKDDRPMATRAGTPYYVSPQVLTGKYDHQCDIWSCGVIMFIMLCGYPPFYGQSDREVLDKVRQGTLSFRDADWKAISEDAKELVRSLICKDPQERLTAAQAVQHPWISLKAPRAAPVPLQANFVDKLRVFQSKGKFAKAALHVIAGQLTESQIKSLRETFTALDDNNDGLLSMVELKDGLHRAGLSVLPADLQGIMEGIDADGSGVIDYTEFIAATLSQKQYIQDDVCWAAFRVFDVNGDGKISLEELRAVLSNGGIDDVVSHESIPEILKQVDKDGDGAIDFDEFMAMLRGSAETGTDYL
jgi:calcium-dependent protein kinase